MDDWDQHKEGGLWNPHFSRNLNDWELERIKEFISRLHGKVVRRNENDKLDWKDNKKGKLILKSFHSFLEQEKTATFPLKAIWNPMVLAKVSVLV